MNWLLLPFVFMAVIWLWPQIWLRIVRGRVDIEVRCLRQYAQVGEAVPIQIVIRNRAWLPCPMVEISLDLPDGLSCDASAVEPTFRRITHMFLRQTLSIESVLYATMRGMQQFKDVQLHLSDGFGLKEIYETRSTFANVSVYPQILTIPRVITQIQALTGQVQVMRWLHEDETMLRGIRPYQSGDRPKHIAWRAMAKTGQIMTKQFSSSTEFSTVILLNGQFFDPFWSGTIRRAFDSLCELACSTSAQMNLRGIPVSFATNAIIMRDPKRQWHGIQRADGVLTILARAQPYANSPLEHVLDVVEREASAQSAIILVTSFLSIRQAKRLVYMQRQGRQIQVIVGQEGNIPPMPPSIQITHTVGVKEMHSNG